MTVITIDEAQLIECDGCGLQWENYIHSEKARVSAEWDARNILGWRIGNMGAVELSGAFVKCCFDDLCPDCALFADGSERDELVRVEGCFDEEK